ncbi:hypothetical protein [Nonomuraea turcica]|uniref:hypothetical protein n=1 Tax=Nonomuraea sp. G32 TaxID=3067274 RepID=UPI00273B292F|nr:hypothetical protein [Nonomuraea sp. G32]MDP4508894.1 hypothetical protein [Nonomuraea sp. G32]
MPTMTTIVAVAMVAILVAAISFVVVQQRWEGIRRHVGRRKQAAPNEGDNRGGAEQVPRTRRRRGATFDIKPLTSESQQACAERWTAIQKQFAIVPGLAVGAADRLVTAAMAECGYPTEDFERWQPELPAAHGRTLHRYRQAHEISGGVAHGSASTEDLRQAMVHYHVLFQELLDNTGEHHPQLADHTRDNQPTSQGDSRNGSRQGDAA